MNGGVPAGDLEADLQRQVKDAVAGRQPLVLSGNGTKSFYGGSVSGRPLAVARHCGMVHYEPTELVVTARAGTLLDELEAALAAEGQMLGFEPPHYGSGATVGGTIACGFSGPRRPFAGSARDFVLGCRLINGRGEIVSFGGRVMKNVAGFDLSRLMVGALGTLGVLLEISLKVLPRPPRELTLAFDYAAEAAHIAMLEWAASALPISALAYDGVLRVRLFGSEQAVSAARRRLGGETADDDRAYWGALNEHRLAFFEPQEPLWRLSVPPAAPLGEVAGAWLLDWGGAQRWLKTDADATRVFAAAEGLGGHATLFRHAPGESRFQPMPENLVALHRKLKDTFDPHRIFNIGRMGWEQ